MNLALGHSDRLVKEALRRSLSGSRFQLAWHCSDAAELMDRVRRQPPAVLLIEPGWLDADPSLPQHLAALGAVVVLITAPGRVGDAYEVMNRHQLPVIEAAILDHDGCLHRAAEFLNRLERCVPASTQRLHRTLSEPAGSTGSTAISVIALGASTGGPRALAQVLLALPADCPAAVILVQHIEAEFSGGLASWLQTQCQLPVEIARRGDSPRGGRVYVAGPEGHLMLDAGMRFVVQEGSSDELHVPSADRLFSSLAKQSSPGAAALLTGMGSDGARGLLDLHHAGWFTVAQDEASSVVYGMPRAAVAAGAATRVLPLNQIAPALLRHFGWRAVA